jgi:hypothetical protein
MGRRKEKCYVSEETLHKLLPHADELAKFGITFEQHESLQKNWGDAVAAIGVGLYIADKARAGTTRDLVQLLCNWAVSKEEILKLRLGEPEQILTYTRMDKPDKEA